MAKVIAADFGTTAPDEFQQTVSIPINRNGRTFQIEIRSDLDTQKLTFSDQLLFAPDDYRLNENGMDVLKVVGAAIGARSETIKEVQIQGHADIRRSGRFPTATGNTELAAMRALEVFKFVQTPGGGGIDPAKTLTSITSFGEFLPVQRDRDNRNYDSRDLLKDNENIELMDKNRRIEIVLIYRR
jgi:flagellar motor protein MotB